MKQVSLYVVQLRKYGRWIKTYWTRQGRPVTLRSAKLAMGRALNRYPLCEYRIRKVR